MHSTTYRANVISTLAISAILSAVILGAAPTNAATIVSSTFTTSDDGWQNGSFNAPSSTTSVVYDPVNQYVQVEDFYGYNAFVAPVSYLGNQSAAFGGTFRFDLADSNNDGFQYAPFTLTSGLNVLYAVPLGIPSTSAAALTTFSISLIGANFRTGDAGGGVMVTDAQLLDVLTSLDRVAINADWLSGSDLVTLDNVALCTAGSCAAGGVPGGVVPEPATWAMMIGGFGLVGGSMRRGRKARTTVNFG